MNDGGERFAELLSVLFADAQELERFLVVEKLQQSTRAYQKGSSRRQSLRTVAEEMVATGAVGDPLFRALARRNPDRTEDIEQIAAFYRDESFTVPFEPDEPVPVMPLPDEFADFAASLSQALDEVGLKVPPDPLDDTHRPWTTAAAVLGAFQPSALRPLGPVRSSAIVTLSGFVHPNLDGQWILKDAVRSRCIDHLWRTDTMVAALDVNAASADTKRDKLRNLVLHTDREPNQLRTQDLEDYAVVMGWLAETDIVDPSDRAMLDATLSRRDLLDPLAALVVGPHFQGRVAELKTVDWFVRGMADKTALCVYGPGGVGKTSLLGKILLDLEQAAQHSATPFVYLDFDRVRNDPRDPAGLLRQIAEQLRLLYATTDEAREFALIEEVSSGTDVERASEILDIDLDLDLDGLLGVLSDRLLRVRNAHGPAGFAAPLVLFLDTFEEVEAKGPGALRDLDQFLGRLAVALPDMRLIVSGRGRPTKLTGFGEPLDLLLGDLDDEAAASVLSGLGVTDPELRKQIVAKFGGNPLTLRLAANALARTGTEVFDVVTRAEVLSGVALEQVQGMLYGRILGHIRDPEVVRVAYPGLAVRRIDVDVLREVLAVPCGLDPDRAQEIFDKLRYEVGMFDRAGANAVSHRQDVRRLMLRTLLDEPQRAATVAEIHRRAAAYYRTRDRAEELYHRLVSGEDPRALDKLWEPTMRQSLEPALGEPLPRRARTWLERRVTSAPDED
ncbi:MAG TPA: ATP-binding protein, partial [Actinokineospora sp.]|nr:ATP-binding protein [Actinokineospora sp.]